MKEIKMLSPTGAIGYSPMWEKSLYEGLEKGVDFIGADGGSPDSGPFYLGAEAPYGTREAFKHDMKHMLLGALRYKIPLILGGVGGIGSNRQVEWTLDIIREISKEENLPRFRAAVIYANIGKEYLKKRLLSGETIKPLGAPKNLTVEDVERSKVIVAQMGIEPFMQALDKDVDVIVAGRACDDAIFAALPIKRGFDPGLVWHCSKIIECACATCVPHNIADSVIGTIGDDWFTIEAAGSDRVASVDSVAAHTMYERSHPWKSAVPGGHSDLKDCVYEQINERTVKVTGSKFIKDDVYTIKLEAVAWVGYRTLGIVGLRDPRLIADIDNFLAEGVEKVKRAYRNKIPEGKYNILFHVYGKNGVMGKLEPQDKITSHELCLITEVVADTQQIATEICSFFDHEMLFHPYKGIISTAGNFAHLNSCEVHEVEGVYEFTMDHLLPISDPIELTELFPIKIVEIGKGNLKEVE